MNGLAPALGRQQRVLLAALILLSALSWIAVVLVSRGASSGGGSMDGMDSTGPASPANALLMGMSGPVFLVTWVVMMAAMMLPAAAPMILTFDAVQVSRSRQGRAIVPTWAFVAGYLAVWSAAGVVAYAAALGAGQVASASPDLAALAPRLGGGLIAAAGLYQLSGLKQRCLSHCRTPTQFVLSSWRNGRRGALRMGVEHGTFCLGCCWLLFAILFPLGIMNVAAMAAAAVLVLAEKTLPFGRSLSEGIGVLLIAGGVLVMLVPSLLPVQA